jgi:hypothetical protein
MNKTKLVAIAMAIAACTTPVEAVTLFTSEMLREGGATTSDLFCSVVNVRNTPISGTVEIIRGDGSVAASTPVTNLPSLQIQGIGLGADPPNFPSAYFCRIDVGAGRPAVRGSLMLLDTNGKTLVSIEAR